MLLTTPEERNRRLDICKSCEHYEPMTKSCGTLGVGKTLKRGRGKVKLCGCIMPLKTKFKMSGCPLKKWNPVHSQKQLDEWETIINGMRGVATAEQQRWLSDTLMEISGVRRTAGNCPPCLANMVDEVKRYIRQSKKIAEDEKKLLEELQN